MHLQYSNIKNPHLSGLFKAILFKGQQASGQGHSLLAPELCF